MILKPRNKNLKIKEITTQTLIGGTRAGLGSLQGRNHHIFGGDQPAKFIV